MKIVCIFAEVLYAFKFEQKNELDRLMSVWKDVRYLYDFARLYDIDEKSDFVFSVLKDVEMLEDVIEGIAKGKSILDFFEPLKATEKYPKTLAFYKGKIKFNKLRLYAIRIEDCFVITGGAIKMSQKMHEHPLTRHELLKLEKCKAYLREQGVITDLGFYELIEGL